MNASSNFSLFSNMFNYQRNIVHFLLQTHPVPTSKLEQTIIYFSYNIMHWIRKSLLSLLCENYKAVQCFVVTSHSQLRLRSFYTTVLFNTVVRPSRLMARVTVKENTCKLSILYTVRPQSTKWITFRLTFLVST